jgi:membrane protein required for colicin V production
VLASFTAAKSYYFTLYFYRAKKMATYTWIDYLIVTIFALSMLTGLKRGFIKEAISLASIIAAFVIAIKFSGSLADWFNASAGAQAVVGSLAGIFGEAHVADALSLITLALSFFVLFLLTMVVGEIINRIASGATSIPGLGFADRMLGAGFGAVRGYLFTVAILFVLNLTAVPQSNAWLQSQWLPSFQSSIIWLADNVKPGLAVVKEKVGQALDSINSGQGGSIYNGASN